MALNGNLETMSLTDLLRWASLNNKTGVLELERSKICRRLVFRDGRVVGCSADDPPSRLGQFLLSRGRITEDALRQALQRQETDPRSIAIILDEMGVLPREEAERLVTEKAEETIYGLFDWVDATFRFEPNAKPDRYTIDIDVSVQDLMTRGLQRHEELARIRAVFESSAIVLQRTDVPFPPEIESSGLAVHILDSIDGERTLADVLLQVRGSEYLVVRFLFNLYHRGVVKIVGRREVDGGSHTTLLEIPGQAAHEAESAPSAIEIDHGAVARAQEIQAGRPATRPPAAPVEGAVRAEPALDHDVPVVPAPGAPIDSPGQPSAQAPDPLPLTAEEDPEMQRDMPALQEETAQSEIDAASEDPANEASERDAALGGAIQLAQKLLARGEYQGGLQVLNGCYRSHPGDHYVRHLILQAESAYLDHLRGGELAPNKIPVRTEPTDRVGNLPPTETFLLDMVDGATDIKSMLWVAPMREVDIFLALRQLVEKGLIRLKGPDARTSAAEGAEPAAVHWA